MTINLEEANYRQNRRTMKKRVSRVIYLGFLITIVLTAVAVSYLSYKGFWFLYEISSRYITHNVGTEMNSAHFLQEMNIASLKDLNPDSAQFRNWIGEFEQDRIFWEESGINLYTPQAFTTHFLLIEMDGEILYSNAEKIMAEDIRQIISELAPAEGEYGAIVRIKRDRRFSVDDLLRFKPEYFFPFYDEGGRIIGSVSAGINPLAFIGLFTLVVVCMIVLVVVMLIIARLISYLLSIPVINPLQQLEENIRSIANEDFSNVVSAKIMMKKPLREIEALAGSTNIILNKMQSYTSLLSHQKQELKDSYHELELQNQQLLESRQRLEEIQALLEEKERAVRNLLDNASEGFLTFNESLNVDPEYSAECVNLFGVHLDHKPIPALLFPGDEEQINLLTSLLRKVFSEKEPERREIYLSLAPQELKINSRHISIDYKIIRDAENSDAEKMMLILHDVSEKRRLELKMEEERSILKMVVKVVSDKAAFNEIINDYRYFCRSEMKNIIGNGLSADAAIYEMFRRVHTFKGSFSQFEMIHIVRRLHEFETKISEFKSNVEQINHEMLPEFFNQFDVINWLDDDLAILKKFLGPQFISHENKLVVDEAKLIEIENSLKSMLSSFECKIVLPALKKLRLQPFRDLLRIYPLYTVRLAERMEKMVGQFEIAGGETPVNHDYYRPFTKSLIHVFRNAVQHGIEPIEERLAKGKEEYGNIKSSVEFVGDKILITIEDDGTGINIEKIKQVALEKRIYDKRKINSLAEHELTRVIFTNEFSTNEEVTEISGRGIGLSAVYDELNKLEGRVEVETVPGKGTKFLFMLPFIDILEAQDFSVLEVMQPVKEIVEEYLSGILPEEYEITLPTVLENNRLQLDKYAVFIKIKGITEGWFIMCFDDEMADKIITHFGWVDDLIGEEAGDDLREDVLAETANTIIGNALGRLSRYGEFITIESPIAVSNSRDASIKYLESVIWSCKYCFSDHKGTLTLALVSGGNQAAPG